MPELNPSAFPGGDFRGYEPARDMTLRDWFAGQALVGLCAKVDFESEFDVKNMRLARVAGEIADGMLAERARGSGA